MPINDLRPVKIVDQINNVNIQPTNKTLVVTGDLSTSDGLTGTISYQNCFTSLIDLLIQWTTILYNIKDDSRFTNYINYGSGTLNLNNYNLFLTTLSVDDQNNQELFSELITTFNSELFNINYQYITQFSKLNTIFTDQMDGSKILDNSNSDLIVVKNLLYQISVFYNNYIINILNNSLLAAQIAIGNLKKLNNTIPNITFLT